MTLDSTNVKSGRPSIRWLVSISYSYLRPVRPVIRRYGQENELNQDHCLVVCSARTTWSSRGGWTSVSVLCTSICLLPCKLACTCASHPRQQLMAGRFRLVLQVNPAYRVYRCLALRILFHLLHAEQYIILGRSILLRLFSCAEKLQGLCCPPVE